MRSILCGLLILLVLYTPVRGYQAGETNGCDANHQASIAQTTTALDYAAACATYTACMDEGVVNALCQMRVVLMLEEGCADRLCELRARLYAATILVYEYPLDFFIYIDPDEVLGETAQVMLTAFDRGDYAAARDAYLNVPPEAYPHSMLYLSLGLINEALGDDEAALAAYEDAWDAGFPFPLLYYVRGSLYEHLGRDIEATVDFHNLTYYTGLDLNLDQFTGELFARYGRDQLVFEQWVSYPVLYNSAGPGGDFYTDQTMNPPAEMPLAIYDGFLLSDAGLPYESQGEFPPLHKYTRTPAGNYRLRLPFDADGGWIITIDLDTEPARMTAEWRVFEGYQRFDALLAPVSEFDPRPELPGERCPGGALTRLVAGGQGEVASYHDPLPLYDAPDGTEIDSVLPDFDTRFTVLDGPTCGSDAAWWQIQTDDDGQTGWIRESNGADYLVLPVATCGSNISPSLARGGTGQVIPDQGANRLRSEPSLNGEVIGNIPGGDSFAVLSDYVCADGYIWWQVEYNGLTGWTAEGEGDTYWLQPE